MPKFRILVDCVATFDVVADDGYQALNLASQRLTEVASSKQSIDGLELSKSCLDQFRIYPDEDGITEDGSPRWNVSVIDVYIA